jgi:hypothetical protein
MNRKEDLLRTLSEPQEIFGDNTPEIMLLSTDDDEAKSLLFRETRRFLREAGLNIGDSEPINLQLLCRRPEFPSEPLNLIVIRKSCRFSEPLKITSLFVV